MDIRAEARSTPCGVFDLVTCPSHHVPDAYAKELVAGMNDEGVEEPWSLEIPLCCSAPVNYDELNHLLQSQRT